LAKGLWVLLNVDNVDKSLEFYKGIGFRTRRESHEEWSWGTVHTSSEDTGIVLMSKHTIAPGQAADTAAWLSGELGKGVLVSLGVSNVDKVWAKAQAFGATVEQPLREQEWGGKEFTLLDPDGYVVNVTDRWPGAEPKRAKKAAKKVAKVVKRAAKAPKKVARRATTKRR
jgi:uncharacterized glyoxalase superfamily protein PhnB